MKFKGTFLTFSFNLNDYQKRLHEHLSDEIAHAAFVWLEALLSEIPTWSGASRATFLQLAREVGYNLSIAPRVQSRTAYGQRHGDGEVAADPQKGLYTFSYETTLRWLIHNEFNSPDSDPNVFYRLLKPGPYYFQRKGQEVFRTFAADVRLPSPWKSLKVHKHPVS